MSMLIGKVEPGDVIGRCRIIRELGRGGVGTVYLATHQTLQIEVALKVLSPALSLDNPALAERFIREAQLAARIRHPNVIAVMDAAHDEPTGLYFIVLEYVGGGALAWHLRNGPLPENKALAITTAIAHALVIAEENIIVHRDIKPDNIMLDSRGTAKLADLGLAKHSIDSRTSLTQGGSYMGTPAYMSPEQARDAKVADTRDDIYSLGATFYECLTGKPPFEGETPYNIMSELLTKPSPKVSDSRPDVSRSVDMICRKMMAKTRGLRYGDARALLHDLQHCQTHGDAGFDKLLAATFARDSIMARQQALRHGVHAPEGGAHLSDGGPDDAPPRLRTVRRLSRKNQPPSDGRAFQAAAWLVALVLVVTGLMALAGRHSFANWRGLASAPSLSSALTQENPAATNSVPSVALKPHKPKPPHPQTATNLSGDVAPSNPTPPVSPRALPVTDLSPTDTNLGIIPALVPGLNGDTNAVPALPADTNAPGYPVAPAAVPQTAFQARDVAEAALSPTIIAPTGKANLLKIIGQHDPSSPSPTTWRFYFYDTGKLGNALYLTVRDDKVVKDGQALTGAVFPWHQDDILPEDKLKVDSSVALATAEALIPGVAVSSSSFELVHTHNEAPMWKLTLWTREADGSEQELGTALILTDTGYVLSSSLYPLKE
jgi:serine/threonine protein kinase